MDRFFLFCFRSCLKGENDHEYYDVLEIDNPNVATIDSIKKQYKKLSLSLHPDKLAQKGIEVTAEHKQKFLKIKEAYDVLSDPKRRRLYDELGASGLKLMENPKEVDPMTILRNYQVRFCGLFACESEFLMCVLNRHRKITKTGRWWCCSSELYLQPF